MIKSFKKSAATGLGAACGAIIAGIVLNQAGYNNLVVHGFLLLISIIIFLYFTKYVANKPEKRGEKSGFFEMVKRDGIRALFNTILFAFVGIELLLSSKGFFSLLIENYYQTIPEEIIDKVVLYNPVESFLLVLAFSAISYLLVNTAINYIGRDAEEMADLTKSSSEDAVNGAA